VYSVGSRRGRSLFFVSFEGAFVCALEVLVRLSWSRRLDSLAIVEAACQHPPKRVSTRNPWIHLGFPAAQQVLTLDTA
jgi:hypothetical protein